jgi:hypothetical protein
MVESPELTQEAWNLDNDSLQTTLCARFRSEVVLACGVVYVAARRHKVPLPAHHMVYDYNIDDSDHYS